MTTVKERVLEIAVNKGIPREKFFSDMNLSYGNFKGKALKSALNSDALAIIIANHPDIDPVWLISGERKDLTNNQVQEPKTVYSLRTDSKLSDQLVPLYDLEAAAGMVNLFNDVNSEKPIDYIQIPNLPKCDGAIYVTGDSMYPILKSGDIVMYKQVHDLRDGIFFGEMYIVSVLIDGDEYVSVKYVQKSDQGNDYIKLVSENKHHGTKDIPLSKVNSMALVKASIRKNSMI